MIQFTGNTGAVGPYLPHFWSEADPRSATAQFHENYAHGGGLNPFRGFEVVQMEDGSFALKYPGDPLMMEVARAALRDERIVLFQYSWLMFIDGAGNRIVARAD